MRKSKKSYQKTKNPRTLWTGLRNIVCQLLKLYITMGSLVSNWMTYGKYSIKHSIQQKIIKKIHIYWMKFLWNPDQIGPFFLKKEFKNTIKKCNNMSMPDSNHVSWKHLKVVIKDNRYLLNIVNIANAYINLGFWLSHFKILSLIIILKPNKIAYNSLKIFWPIIFLNTLDKLIKKVIGDRLQNQSIASKFIYLNQLGKLKQCSTTDVGIFLTYFIYSE